MSDPRECVICGEAITPERPPTTFGYRRYGITHLEVAHWACADELTKDALPPLVDS